MYIFRINYLITALLLCTIFCSAAMARSIECKIEQGILTINPAGMELVLQPNHNNAKLIPIVAASTLFAHPRSITEVDSGQKYEIIYDNCKAIIDISDSSINFKIYPKSDILVKWPVITENPAMKSYLLPHGEGLFIPIDDSRIRSVTSGMQFDHCNKMPFLGIIYDNFALTIIEHIAAYRTQIKMAELGQGISYEYDFRSRDKQPVYELSFVFSQPKLLEPAKIFRSFLQKNNNFVTLAEKIKHNPKIKDLAGAIHIYTWGSGCTIDTLNMLKQVGISKAWVGYIEKEPNSSSDNDAEPTTYYVPKMYYANSDFIESAKNHGYLVGVYDSYHTAMPSNRVDCYNVDFGPDSYPKYCAYDSKGKRVPGFHNRGCSVSMTAFVNDGNIIMHQRIDKFKDDGVNSYFLDCHGTGEVFDDYSPDHPQTIFDDISIRLQHLKFLSQQGLVLGTESAIADAAPFVAFAHGNFSTLYNTHYKLARNTKEYGAWYPPARPGFFFKTIIADNSYALRYDPQYRIPLFQAVLHDSIVTTDRWEIPLVKFKNLYEDRFLLEFLCGVPSMWSLDSKAIKQYENVLKQIGKEFYDLHSQIMTEELTDFQFLTDDRKVQKTVFGDNKVSIIANFRDTQYQDIPQKALKIIYNDNDIRIIKPEVPKSFIKANNK